MAIYFWRENGREVEYQTVQSFVEDKFTKGDENDREYFFASLIEALTSDQRRKFFSNYGLEDE